MRSVGDVTGVPLASARVRAGMLVGLLIAVASSTLGQEGIEDSSLLILAVAVNGGVVLRGLGAPPRDGCRGGGSHPLGQSRSPGHYRYSDWTCSSLGCLRSQSSGPIRDCSENHSETRGHSGESWLHSGRLVFICPTVDEHGPHELDHSVHRRCKDPFSGFSPTRHEAPTGIPPSSSASRLARLSRDLRGSEHKGVSRGGHCYVVEIAVRPPRSAYF